MKEIKFKTIQDEFNRFGYHFKMVYKNNGRRIYQQTNIENPDNYYYEVIEPISIKGTNEFHYPSSSQWGQYGKTLMKNQWEKALEYCNNGWKNN